MATPTLNPHWATLYNYLSNLTPQLNKNLELAVRDIGSQKRYSWMFDVCRFESHIGQWKNTWVDAGQIEPIRAREEGKVTPAIQLPDAFTAEMQTALWGDHFPITDEFIFYAQKKLQLIPDIDTYVTKFAEGILKRQADMIANIYLDAFTGATYLGSDGKALCASAHTFNHGESALSNAFVTPLSVASLTEMRDNTRVWVDSDGQPLMMNYDTLIIGPSLEDAAAVIMESRFVPGSGNNDINPHFGRYNIVTVPWLDELVATGAGAFHFLLDSSQHTIEMHITRDPTIEFLANPYNKDMRYERKADFNADWYASRGIAGSTGTGS